MFEFSTNVFAWTLINFIVLLFIVHKFALPSFLKMVDESEKNKEKLLADIKANNEESTRLLAEYKSKLALVEDEVKRILHQANQDGEKIRKSQMEEALKEKNALLKDLKTDLASERTQVLADIREHAADLIVAATTKIIGKEVSKDAHYELIKDDVKEFEKIVNL